MLTVHTLDIYVVRTCYFAIRIEHTIAIVQYSLQYSLASHSGNIISTNLYGLLSGSGRVAAPIVLVAASNRFPDAQPDAGTVMRSLRDWIEESTNGSQRFQIHESLA